MEGAPLLRAHWERRRRGSTKKRSDGKREIAVGTPITGRPPPHDAEDKLQLGQQCFEDYNFTFSEIFSAADSLWPAERRGLSSVSRYRAVLASFTCPSSNCAALRSPVS